MTPDWSPAKSICVSVGIVALFLGIAFLAAVSGASP